eukprot:SAG22_NODE_173_length_16589_cov_120.738933_11_plen_252_part_00
MSLHMAIFVVPLKDHLQRAGFRVVGQHQPWPASFIVFLHQLVALLVALQPGSLSPASVLLLVTRTAYSRPLFFDVSSISPFFFLCSLCTLALPSCGLSRTRLIRVGGLWHADLHLLPRSHQPGQQQGRWCEALLLHLGPPKLQRLPPPGSARRRPAAAALQLPGPCESLAASSPPGSLTSRLVGCDAPASPDSPSPTIFLTLVSAMLPRARRTQESSADRAELRLVSSLALRPQHEHPRSPYMLRLATTTF